MAIINCPSCHKRISSMNTLCPHCGFELDEVSEEDLQAFEMRQARERVYRLKMVSYAVITVFVAGFGWYWYATGGFQRPSGTGPYIVMGLSAVGYLVVRGLLFVAQGRLRRLKRGRP